MDDGARGIGDGEDDPAGGEGVQHHGEYAARTAERGVVVVVADDLLGLFHLLFRGIVIAVDELIDDSGDAVGRQMVGCGATGGGGGVRRRLVVGGPQGRTVFGAEERREQAERDDQPVMPLQRDFGLSLEGSSIHMVLFSECETIYWAQPCPNSLIISVRFSGAFGGFPRSDPRTVHRRHPYGEASGSRRVNRSRSGRVAVVMFCETECCAMRIRNPRI